MKDFAKVVPPEWGLVLCPRQEPMGSQVALVVKNLPANAGDRRDLGWGKKETWVQPPYWEDPLGGGNSNTLQSSCLEHLKDGGAWQAAVHWVTKSQHH